MINLALLSVLWYRRQYQAFPFFSSLILLSVFRTIGLYLVRKAGGGHRYDAVYLLLSVIDTLLQLAVVYEVAGNVFRPMKVWAFDLRKRFGWLTGLSVTMALSLAWLAAPSAQTPLKTFTLKGTLFADALMAELFVAMMMISLSVGVPLRSHAAAIAQGLGAYSLIGVMIRAGHAWLGLDSNSLSFIVLYHGRMVVYLGCAVFWIVNLNSEEEPSRTMTSEMSASLSSLQMQLAGDLRAIRFRKR